MKRLYIITTAGGLGNQMLNYSLWYYLKYHKKENAILYPIHKHLKDHNGYELDEIFKNTEKPRQSNKLIDLYISLCILLNRIGCFVGKKIHTKRLNNLSAKLPISVVNFPNWEKYNFIEEIRAEIIEIFSFVEDSNKKNVEVVYAMRETESVSIHIRRGDYQNNVHWRMILGDICDLSYYQQAIEKVSELINTPSYFVFSDDIDWAKENLKLPQATYIDWNTKSNSYRDIQLMANCRINIIANSTFSLMGAWLNTNNNYQCIAPKKWRNYYHDTTYQSYLPLSWIVIDNARANISLILSKSLSDKELHWILNQSYSDFEIIPTIQEEHLANDRLKESIASPVGNYIFKITSIQTKEFKNKHYISYLLFNKISSNG